jgi:small subunit ribosomal protein S2
MEEDGTMEQRPKKEAISLRRERARLEKNLGGIAKMPRLPDAIFIIDVRKEHIALREANRLKIPVVAVVDTNCDPDGVDYLIPGNDDAIRAIRLFAQKMADACVEGVERREKEGLGIAPAMMPPPPVEPAMVYSDDETPEDEDELEDESTE